MAELNKLGIAQSVLLHTIHDKPKQAYGKQLHSRLEEVLDKPVDASQVYAALTRLRKRGLIRYSVREERTTRGRPKEMYELTPAGVREVANLREIFVRAFGGWHHKMQLACNKEGP